MYLVYDNVFQKIRLGYFEKIIEQYGLKKRAKLLDYGCGPGDMILVARKKGLDAYGIDSFKRSVDLAKKRGLKVKLGDSKKMPYKKNFFDVIFLQSVLEHNADAVGLVEDLKKYLKKGGLLILSSPTPSSYFWNDPTHVRPHTPKSFATLGEICNLEALDITFVFSFLLGLHLKNSLFYKILNIVPYSLGSNIIGIYRKK